MGDPNEINEVFSEMGSGELREFAKMRKLECLRQLGSWAREEGDEELIVELHRYREKDFDH
jgi:hypothetical protein